VAQQKRAGVRGDGAAIEISHNFAPGEPLKLEFARRYSVGIGPPSESD
jgi:hypothetical protein